jgi:hypothetical protein
MPIEYQFPPNGDSYFNEIPVWMKFYCAKYSTFSENRTRSNIKKDSYVTIKIPYPQEKTTLNSQDYVKAPTLNVRTVERGFGGFGEMVSANFNAISESASSFLSGGGVVRFDHFETVLSPGARRTHNFNIMMVGKNKAQTAAANDIAAVFQTNVFPIASNGSILNMLHPPLWYFHAICAVDPVPQSGTKSGLDSNVYWDTNPLVSVLKSVDINKSSILNTPFASPDYFPIAVNIKLSFIELEPALQKGDGTLNIISRSERLNGSS